MGIFNNIYRDADHAADTDVRLGVDYANDDLQGKLDLPAESDVRLGVEYDGANETGTLNVDVEANLPAENEVLFPVTFGSTLQFTGAYFNADVGDVRLGTNYGKDATAVGLLDLPAVADVRLGTQFDQATQTGLIAVPATTEVLLGVAIDQGVGNNRQALETDVRITVAYGPNDTLIGSLDTSGGEAGYPAVSDVRLDVVYANGELTGNVRVPPMQNVLMGYEYDTLDSFIGTLDPVIESPFFEEDDFQIVRGDDYVGDDIHWTDDGRWPDLTGATAKFGGFGGGVQIEYPCVVNGQTVELPLEKAETVLVRNWYRYDVQATLTDGTVKTLARGRMRALDTGTDPPADSPLPPASPA